jgi:hypothetical protein
MGYYFTASATGTSTDPTDRMRPRDLIALSSALILLVSTGILILSGTPADAGDRMPPAAPAAPVQEPGNGPDRAAAQEVPFEPMTPVATADGDFRKRDTVDTTGWTSGIIMGDVLIATSVLAKVQAVTVMVEELRNPVDANGNVVRPWQRAQAVELTEGTPTFEIKDVPFSKYGYVVRAYAAGFNGGQQTVAINDMHPREDGVQLMISPGVPFSVWLRDQDQLAVAGTTVLMVPIGEPAGRPRPEGTSDNFGSVVFESVLAGDYQIYVGHPSQPLIPPETVTVQIAGRTFGPAGQVQSQGRSLTVPRGVPLPVLVKDTNFGYGIADATVKLTATDKVKLLVLEATTDVRGIASFPHLLPGSWQIDVFKDDYSRRSGQITIKDRELPPQQEFTLARLR